MFFLFTFYVFSGFVTLLSNFGLHQVEYNHKAGGEPAGRAYVSARWSMYSDHKLRCSAIQGCPADLRPKLTGKYLRDFDGVCSDLKIYVILAKEASLPDVKTKEVRAYMGDRAHWHQKVATHYCNAAGWDSDHATIDALCGTIKRWPNALGNGSGHDGLLKMSGLPAGCPPEPDSVLPLLTELRQLKQALLVAPCFQDFVRRHCERLTRSLPGIDLYKLRTKIFSLLVATREHEILTVVVQKLRVLNRLALGPSLYDCLPPQDRQVGALIFDGHMVELHIDEGAAIAQVNADLAQRGWDYQIAVKPNFGLQDQPVASAVAGRVALRAAIAAYPEVAQAVAEAGTRGSLKAAIAAYPDVAQAVADARAGGEVRAEFGEAPEEASEPAIHCDGEAASVELGERATADPYTVFGEEPDYQARELDLELDAGFENMLRENLVNAAGQKLLNVDVVLLLPHLSASSLFDLLAAQRLCAERQSAPFDASVTTQYSLLSQRPPSLHDGSDPSTQLSLCTPATPASHSSVARHDLTAQEPSNSAEKHWAEVTHERQGIPPGVFLQIQGSSGVALDCGACALNNAAGLNQYTLSDMSEASHAAGVLDTENPHADASGNWTITALGRAVGAKQVHGWKHFDAREIGLADPWRAVGGNSVLGLLHLLPVDHYVASKRVMMEGVVRWVVLDSLSHDLLHVLREEDAPEFLSLMRQTICLLESPTASMDEAAQQNYDEKLAGLVAQGCDVDMAEYALQYSRGADHPQLDALVLLGFDRSKAEAMLCQTSWDLPEAAGLLLAGVIPEEEHSGPEPSQVFVEANLDSASADLLRARQEEDQLQQAAIQTRKDAEEQLRRNLASQISQAKLRDSETTRRVRVLDSALQHVETRLELSPHDASTRQRAQSVRQSLVNAQAASQHAKELKAAVLEEDKSLDHLHKANVAADKRAESILLSRRKSEDKRRAAILASASAGKTKSGALAFASQEMRSDRDVVLAAVAARGAALEAAAPALTNDKKIVLAAVRNNGTALAFASKSLQSDKDVCMAAVVSGVSSSSGAAADDVDTSQPPSLPLGGRRPRSASKQLPKPATATKRLRKTKEEETSEMEGRKSICKQLVEAQSWPNGGIAAGILFDSLDATAQEKFGSLTNFLISLQKSGLFQVAGNRKQQRGSERMVSLATAQVVP